MGYNKYGDFMNKKYIIISIIIILILVGTGFFFWNQNNKNKNLSQYEANKTASNSNKQSGSENTSSSENIVNENRNNIDNSQKDLSATDNNETNSQIQSQNLNNSNNEANSTLSQNQISQNPPVSQPIEEQIAIFSTKIYNSDPARQNNITITCKTLHGTIVKNGDTFSFCNTVGPATTSKGYQQADIFDKYGNKKKGLGGGNCQISSTLYNAVSSVPSLIITERHQHSNYVPYIQKGKDAAVAYGSYDFKFRNNSGNDIKICAEANSTNVTTSIIALK